ncbi:hypothetical protein CYMTET_24989 [Cymbomonas tetramitiformis]|uniref:Uncharacterized protein n=1 Tax=Cymbomonas tetramitiformis TaxID=36881 RepID=A0AAE0FV41_9CHLO|nr:hypothetical protein CYMTET_24989 [Cymbomonas tetramitiformis]
MAKHVCAPVELSAGVQHALSLCYIFQQAADVRRRGRLRLLRRLRITSEDIDGSDDEDLDEIREFKKQVESAAAGRGVSFTHASFGPQPVAEPPAAVLP